MGRHNTCLETYLHLAHSRKSQANWSCICSSTAHADPGCPWPSRRCRDFTGFVCSDGVICLEALSNAKTPGAYHPTFTISLLLLVVSTCCDSLDCWHGLCAAGAWMTRKEEKPAGWSQYSLHACSSNYLHCSITLMASCLVADTAYMCGCGLRCQPTHSTFGSVASDRCCPAPWHPAGVRSLIQSTQTAGLLMLRPRTRPAKPLTSSELPLGTAASSSRAPATTTNWYGWY